MAVPECTNVHLTHKLRPFKELRNCFYQILSDCELKSLVNHFSLHLPQDSLIMLFSRMTLRKTKSGEI